jgi:hypothetical protein
MYLLKCVYLELSRDDVYKTEYLYSHILVTDWLQIGHRLDTEW